MTKVTLTIETEKDEDPRQALARFLGIHPDKVGPPPADGSPLANGRAAATVTAVSWTPEDLTSPPLDWTPGDFTGFWNGLTTDAKKILAEIAKKPNGCLAGDIEGALGLRGRHLGGRMSSVGHQMNRYPGRPRVWDWNQATGGYTLSPQLADWVTRLASDQTIA